MPEVPITMVDGSEAAVRPQPLLTHDSETNFGDDVATAEFVMANIIPLLTVARNDRLSEEQVWHEIDQIDALIHNNGRRYLGRSNMYLPLGKRIMNTIGSNIRMGLFPSDDYIEVAARTDERSEDARAVKSYMQWEFDRNANVRREVGGFARNGVKYGNAVLKYGFQPVVRYEARRKPREMAARQVMEEMARSGGQYVPPQLASQYVRYAGLRVSNRPIYNFYAWPFSVSNIDDAQLVFEDFDITVAESEELVRQKKWLPFTQLHKETGTDWHRMHAAANHNMTDSLQSANGSKFGLAGTVTEVWTYMPVPRSLYTEDEKPGCYVPVVVMVSGPTILRVARNPWAHQMHPYVMHAREQESGWLWGRGYGHAIKGLQYLINDTANQVNDCGNYTLNPIVKTVLGGVVGNKLSPIKPGVQWWLHDINAVAFDRPPADLIQYGSSLLQMWMSIYQDVGGAPPMMQGVGGGKAAKTATGAQILQRNLSVPLRDEVEDIEIRALTPLLFRSWLLCQQFREQPVMVTVAGQNIEVTPDMLAIDADFRWLASSQAANSQQRAQQSMQLIQVVAPLVQMLAQQGYQVDFSTIIRRIYSDGFGFRGFDQFIKQGPPPGMPGMPGGPGGMPQPGQEVRSNAGQSSIPGSESVEGEGEAFGDVRDNADYMAAMMGQFGGGGT
jgi:hypothetical protein